MIRKIEADDGITTEIVTVTPDMAGDWLAKNTHNRVLNERRVLRYARIMKMGAWKLNGEAIKFDTNGQLSDGQHRLSGCIVAGVPFVTLVIRGVPPDSFETLDSGKTRSLADALGLLGEVNCADLAASIVLHLRYEQRQMASGFDSPSATEGIQHLNAHERLRDSVRVGSRTHGKVPCAASVLAVAYYLFSEIDAVEAEIFMQKLAIGAELAKDDPIFRLRERFITDRSAKLKMLAPERLALTIKAWNFWRQGKTISQLQWRVRQGEIFPEPA